MPDLEYEELGVPVRSVNWVRTHPGSTPSGQDRVWVTMGQQAQGFFVLDIDPVSGDCSQVSCPHADANFPTATCLSRDGILYIGAAYKGHLYSYDGSALKDLGAINPDQATFPCRIDEAGDGGIWIGSYGKADLTRYDPGTGEFERFGSMDDVDMYCYPMVDHQSGLIACLIKMTRQHVVLFDSSSGDRVEVGPSMTKEEGVIDLVRGTDERLYITGDGGNFSIQGRQATPYDGEIQIAEPVLQSGETFSFSDAETFLYRKLELRDRSGTTREVEVEYEAAGSEIFMLHEGPDRKVYGSSILPLHLFVHDPADGSTVDYGKASESGGEAYSMANHEGQIYISSYPAARVSVYDPVRSYRYGTDESGNPRELGRIDEISYRPRTTLSGPLGRIWTASLPDYGLWGGPLAWLDPETGDRGSYRNVAGEGSCYTLAALPDNNQLAIGTTILAGTGTEVRAEEAKLVVWDCASQEAVWEGTPEAGLTAINALRPHAGGLLGTATAEGKGVLFRFEPGDRAFTVLESDLPGRPLDHGLVCDGQSIYGLTRSTLYRLDGSGIECLQSSDDDLFDVPGPIIDGWLYFGTNHQLRRIRVTD